MSKNASYAIGKTNAQGVTEWQHKGRWMAAIDLATLITYPTLKAARKGAIDNAIMYGRISTLGQAYGSPVHIPSVLFHGGHSYTLDRLVNKERRHAKT